MKRLLLLSIPLLFAGCISPKTSPVQKNYQLLPAETMGTSSKEFTLPFLVIGPVEINLYLDQSRFALRVNDHQIQYQDYQRWAEPLGNNISNVLSANLRTYFQVSDILPNTPRLLLGKEQLRVIILVNRMDVDLEGKALLDVQWFLINPKQKKEALIHTGTYTGTAADTTMLSRVTALNKLLTEFSLDLAKGLEKEL